MAPKKRTTSSQNTVSNTASIPVEPTVEEPVPMQEEVESVAETLPEVSDDVQPATKTIVKKTRKPVKSKSTGTRTPSSYVLFSMEYRKVVTGQFPDLSLGEVSKKCGEKWKELSEDEKNEWKDKWSVMKAERNPVNENEEPKKKKKPSSYLCFSMDHRKKVLADEPKLSLGEVSKRCGAEWKNLTTEQKEEWKQKADAL